MAQQDVQQQPTAPTPAPLDLRKVVIGLLVALAGGGTFAGVDAAGYKPDFTVIGQAFGIGGAILLIAYLHYVWLPLIRSKGTTLDRLESKVDKLLDRVPEPAKAAAPVLRLATSPPAAPE